MKFGKIAALCGFVALGSTSFAAAADHLLLSEILVDALNEADSSATDEYLEIFNPTAGTIDLSNYYLCDHPNYINIVSSPSGLALGSSDHLLRFPQGTTLQSGQVAVVVSRANLFFSRYFSADHSAYYSQPGPAAPLLFEVNDTYTTVPQMTNLNTDTSASLNFTNASATNGEHETLFYWNGASDLVQDVDIVAWGNFTGSSTNKFSPKSPSVSKDGPDADAVATPYKTDAGTHVNLSVANVLQVITRNTTNEPGETQVGTGNGITGHDESTENCASSWTITADTTPNPIPSGHPTQTRSVSPGTTNLPYGVAPTAVQNWSLFE